MDWKNAEAWKVLGLRVAAFSEKWGNWIAGPLAVLFALFCWWRIGWMGLAAGAGSGFYFFMAIVMATSLKLPLTGKEASSFYYGAMLGTFSMLMIFGLWILGLVAGIK